MDVYPLFCLRTIDKRTRRTLYINFGSSDKIPEPDVDINEEQITREIYQPTRFIESLKIPLVIGQIYWSNKDDDNSEDRSYVIDVQMNDKFALRKILPSEIIRHFLFSVALESIEQKFNSTGAKSVIKQFVGHSLDLDRAGYEIIEDKLSIEPSKELVNNKVTFAEEQSLAELEPESSSSHPDEDDKISYELHFRPKSMFLTCSINTHRLPKSIGFNDDTFVINLDEKQELKIQLPLNIDLNQPVKYKFDYRLCLFRIVFKLVELFH